MNIRSIVAGAVLLSAGSFGLWQWFSSPIENSETSEYVPREGASAEYSADDQFRFKEMLTKNINTGKVEKSDFMRLREIVRDRPQKRASFLTWEERGPDNIGGRCRAILIDQNNDFIVYAGSVSGGMYKSTNGGNNWSRLDGFTENLAVSSIAQTPSGTIYVGTGHQQENISGIEESGAEGGGLFYSTDDGASWTLVAGTSSYDNINELVADPNYSDRVWMACDNGLGLKVVENAGSSITDADAIGTGLPLTGVFESLAISPDGSVIVAGNISTSVKTYVSNDGGQSWASMTGSGTGQIPGPNGGRIEYSISFNKNSGGSYNIFALNADSGGDFDGAYMSDDNGNTWYEIAPPPSVTSTPPHPDVQAIFGDNTQGKYDNIVTAVPGNPGRAFFGGIDIWEWNQAQSSPPFGQFEQRTIWYGSPASPVYAHADQHEMKWDSQGNLYIGNDGGIGKSPTGSFNGEVWFPANKGFNATQYYYIAYSKNGAVMGGAQDNGTTYNDGTGNTPLEFREVMGGDGFACDISFLNDDVLFTSSQGGSVLRSDDRGSSAGTFFSDAINALAGGNGYIGSFYTCFRLYEDGNDTGSLDSVAYLADTLYGPGDSVTAQSQTFQYPLDVVLTDSIRWTDSLIGTWSSNDSSFFSLHPASGDTIWMGQDSILTNVPLDTLMVQDPYQSLFVFGIGGGNGVFITREALRFSSNPFWWQIKPTSGTMGQPKIFEFAKDGDILYVGTWAGEVYRIKGLSTLYATEHDTGYAMNDASILPYTISIEKIYQNSSVVTGISVDKNDPGHVMISLGNFGGTSKVMEATNADVSPGTANFTSIQGDLPVMPTYSIVMDRNDPDIVVVGTEMGIWATQNASAASPTWEQSTEVGNVGVYDMRQDWRSWTEGSKFPGTIYAGTHGRGIWSTGTLLNIDKPEYPDAPDKFTTELLIYPNPMATQGQVKFELSQRSDVQVNVYSLTGKRVSSISRKNMSAGEHRIDLEPGKLSNGTYLVEVVAGNDKDVSRFVVSR